MTRTDPRGIDTFGLVLGALTADLDETQRLDLLADFEGHSLDEAFQATLHGLLADQTPLDRLLGDQHETHRDVLDNLDKTPAGSELLYEPGPLGVGFAETAGRANGSGRANGREPG